MQPQPPFVLMPGTETWAERYGVIGVVASLLLLAFALIVRQLLIERREDRQRIVDLTAKLFDATAKLVENGAVHHREALGLVGDLQSKHEQRYSALLERHIGETGKYADALREQNNATTSVLASLAQRPGAD